MRRPPFGHRLREFRDPLRSQIPAVGSLMVPFGTSGSEWPLANQHGTPPVMRDGLPRSMGPRSSSSILEGQLFKTCEVGAEISRKGKSSEFPSA